MGRSVPWRPQVQDLGNQEAGHGLAGAAVEDQLAGYGTMNPIAAMKDSAFGAIPLP